MNIADRIQQLRKAKGISQEQLADRLGVSRQAVSKWESEQSMPDLDKIIIMSDYFEVTTDYILKGIEQEKSQGNSKPHAGIFTIVATVFNFLGVIMAAFVWFEEQRPGAIAIGMIFLAIGCMIFGIGMMVSEPVTKAKAKRYFWMINVWLLSFIPLSCCFNVLDGAFGGFVGRLAPLPLLGNSLVTYGLFWIIYIAICIVIDVMVVFCDKKRAK